MNTQFEYYNTSKYPQMRLTVLMKHIHQRANKFITYLVCILLKSTALNILVDHQNMVGWWLAFKYMQTPLTHYFLESSGQSTYMETHPNSY